MKNFEITIASVPDMDDLVAEIWFQNHLIAEINQETGIKVRFFSYDDSEDHIGFDLDNLIKILIEAKERLSSEEGIV